MSVEETSSQTEFRNDLLCKKCGADPIDRSENPHSVLCKFCRVQHIHFPFPLGIKLLFAALLLAAAVSVVQFAYVAEDYKTISLADQAYELGNQTTAYRLYSELYQRNPSSDKLGQKLFKAAVLVFDYDLAGDLYSEHLYDHKVSDEEYRELNPLVESMIQYYDDTYIFVELAIPDDAPLEDVLGILRALPDKEQNALTRYLLLADVVQERDFSAMAVYLEGLLSGGTTEYLDILPQMASCYRHLEQYDRARDYVRRALARNREHPEALRQLAVIELLTGNTSAAVSAAERAFEVSPNEQYVADTLAMSYYLSGDDEGLARVAAYAKANGLVIDSYPDVAAGTKTVQDIYLGGL